MEILPQRHRITVEEYYRMGELGLLGPEERVELIEGEVIDMPPIGVAHSSVVARLTQQLVLATTGRAIVRCQLPLRLSRYSEPQPDFALVAPKADFYGEYHPTAADALLVIEISHSTLRYDRDVKLPLYARHAVPEVWIIDLNAGVLHRYSSPVNGEYGEAIAGSPGKIPIARLPTVILDLTALA